MKKWIALLLAVMMALSLAACAKKTEPAGSAEPVGSADAEEKLAASAEPAELADNPLRQDGERFETTITVEGMEETVTYEHLRNDVIGIEMDYDCDHYVRQSEPDRERFISVWDAPENPENYLEVTYSSDDAETVAAAIGERLSEDYEIIRESATLAGAGSCIRIGASEIKGGGYTANVLQMVYIIPAPDGCRIAAAHYDAVDSDGISRRFDAMVNTLAVVDLNG